MEAKANRSLFTILLVDDNRDIVEAVTMVLESEGFQTEAAHGGFEALRKVRQFDPSRLIILMDLNMPGMNGDKVIEHLNADHSTASIPVIMMTAESNPHLLPRCYGTLKKPFDLAPLITLLDRAITERT